MDRSWCSHSVAALVLVRRCPQNGAIQLRAQPSIVTGNMRAYQLEGLNWYDTLWIAADELAMPHQ